MNPMPATPATRLANARAVPNATPGSRGRTRPAGESRGLPGNAGVRGRVARPASGPKARPGKRKAGGPPSGSAGVRGRNARPAPSPGSGQAGLWREAGGRIGALARLGRDTRAAIGVPGVLVAAMLVGATALPVANVNLKADNRRMEDAAAAAGLAATEKMRAEGAGVDAAVLRREADRYARLNLLDLPPDARRKALQSLDIRMTTDPHSQTVQVDLSATLPGRNAVTALLAAAGAGGAVLPEKTTGKSRVQCIADKVELVLAIDMTKSMNAQIEQTGVSGSQWPERIDQTVAVAAEMVDNIHRLCSDLELKVGIVPWASTVKVPDGQETRWKDNGWIDRSRFAQWGTLQSQGIEARWGGCLEDRLMDTSAEPRSSMGLTLDTAEDRHFPPYVYPDTERHTKREAWAQTMQRFLRAQRAQGLTGLPDDGDLAMLADALRGDNDWSRGGGPNKGCTPIGMIPPRTLTSEDTWLTEALADIGSASLTDEGTLAHLGVTWGRRMLHPAWDAIWDPAGAADDAKGGSEKTKDESVTQVLVLLSDGINSMKGIDPWNTVPGRARVVLGRDPATLDYAIGMPGTLSAQEATQDIETAVVTGYSALGRNGPGARADGHRRDTANITSNEGGNNSWDIPDMRRKSRDFLDGLLTASCSEARREGIEVYTVSLSSGDSTHQNTVLQSCAGTKDAAGAADYAFQATDVDGIKAAFRDIGQRVARIRRAG